ATFDVAAGKMSFDQDAWELAANLESASIPKARRTERGFGSPSWSLPPHVLLVDMMGNTKGIVTPYGRLDVQDFSKVPEEQRQEAMDLFLDQMAKVMPSSGYMHLYFRYFFEYILDSPVTSRTALLGCRKHCGDIHQTTYQ